MIHPEPGTLHLPPRGTVPPAPAATADYPCIAVWTDGGCVKSNPSPWGGSWAWRQTDARGYVLQAVHGHYIACGVAGCQDPEHWPLPVVTNNAMEFVAVVLALEYLPDGWAGKVCSDSQLTLQRLRAGAGLAGIPTAWVRKGAAQLQRLGAWTPVLIKGHPSKESLRRGYVDRPGGPRPVSRHNVDADRDCRWECLTLQQRFQGQERWGCPTT